MAITTFDLQELEKLGVQRANIADTVAKLGMSLENLDGQSATIDITPNRPDMLDIIGFARAALYFTGKKVPKEKFYSLNDGKPEMQINVTNSVRKIRPFIAALVVKNADLSGSKLKNLINFTEKFCETYGRKRKKIAMGIHNFDVLSNPLTYDASKDAEFIPLGSKEKQSFGDILKNNEKGIAYSGILGKSKVYPYIKDSRGNVLSLIPIINSEYTRISNGTKNLLVEMTSTSRNAVESAINMITCSFIDAGAQVYSCEIVYKNKNVPTPALEYKTVKIRRSKAENTLGVNLEDNKMVALANKLGHVAAKYGNSTLVYVPPYRLDVFNDQDIIEDLAIAYGYDKIEPMPISATAVARSDEFTNRISRISKLFVGLGFSEAVNPYLTNELDNFDKIGKKRDEKSVIKVAYAKTEAITMLRTHLLPLLMENLSASMNERMPQKLFETGHVFRLDGGKIIEGTNLAVVSEHSKANYSEIKSVITDMFRYLDVEFKLKEFADASFIEGRCAKIVAGNDTLGYFGEISPRILRNFKLEEPVVAAEVDLYKALKIISE